MSRINNITFLSKMKRLRIDGRTKEYFDELLNGCLGGGLKRHVNETIEREVQTNVWRCGVAAERTSLGFGPLICKCFTNNFPSSYSFFSVTYWFHKELLSFYFSPLLTVMTYELCILFACATRFACFVFDIYCILYILVKLKKIDLFSKKKMRDKNRRSGSYVTRIRQVALLYPC